MAGMNLNYHLCDYMEEAHAHPLLLDPTVSNPVPWRIQVWLPLDYTVGITCTPITRCPQCSPNGGEGKDPACLLKITLMLYYSTIRPCDYNQCYCALGSTASLRTCDYSKLAIPISTPCQRYLFHHPNRVSVFTQGY